MKIVVCIKTATGAATTPADAFERAGRVSPALLAQGDRHAIEEALRLVEKHGDGEIVVVSLGSAECVGAMREALALGCDRAVLAHEHPALGSDPLETSRWLARLLRMEPADLYLYGPWSGNVDGSLLWSMTGQRMGLPTMTQARSLRVDDGRVFTERQVEGGDLSASAGLPCLVEVAETINKPRYPTLKGKQLAKGRPIRLVSLDSLDSLEKAGADAGAHGPGTAVGATLEPKGRGQPAVWTESDDPVARLLALLREKGFA